MDHTPHASPLPPHRAATRIIALGSAPLMDGFRLAGVEVMANASSDELEALLMSLVSNKEKALVLIESGLADEPGPWLERVRTEGGRVVVVQVPSLAGAGDFHSDVDRLIGLSGDTV